MVKRGFLSVVLMVSLFFAGLGFVSAGDTGSGFISDISSETTRVMYIGDVLGFNAIGGRHTFIIAGIKDGSVSVRTAQPIQSSTIAVGGEMRLDFDGDNVMDFYVRINNILPSGKAANVTVKTISETIPVEAAPVSNKPVAPVISAPLTSGEEPKENVSSNFGEQKPETTKKSSNAWLWIVIVVVLVGIAAYFAVKKLSKGNRLPHLN